MAVNADQTTYGDDNLGSERWWDGFGRTTSSVLHENWRGTWGNTITSSVPYDPLGRKRQSRQARSAPVSASGSANTECSNLIMSSGRCKRVQKRFINS